MSFLAHTIFHLEYLKEAGPIFLFFALSIGIVGIPVPGEVLLVGAGYLAATHKMSVPLALTAAITGSAAGITITYLIGRLVGYWFVRKYGPMLNITPEHIQKVKGWFRKMGKWTLVIGYYIPFFRHLVGFVAGSAKLDFKYFALYAYSGAVIWASLFFAIGYYFYPYFHQLFHNHNGL